MTVKEMRVYTAARRMAADADLCRMLALTPDELEAHRALIERARAEALVEMRYVRAQKSGEEPASPLVGEQPKAT